MGVITTAQQSRPSNAVLTAPLGRVNTTLGRRQWHVPREAGAAFSGSAQLDVAAQAAVRRWQFIPATQAGSPVAAIAEVPVRFRLDN